MPVDPSGGILPAPSYYLKIDDIPGDSVHPKHENEIPALSFGWGASQSALPKSVRAGKPSVAIQNVRITAPVSSASPLLFAACASGRTIKTATFVWAKEDQGELFAVMTLVLTDVVVSSYDVEGRETANPTDSFSLSFGKVDFLCRGQNADGSLGDINASSWDLRLNVV